MAARFKPLAFPIYSDVSAAYSLGLRSKFQSEGASVRSRSTPSIKSSSTADAQLSLLPLMKQSPASWELWKQLDDHQKEVVALACNRKTLAVFAEQGTGKTWIASALWERLATESAVALFIVPLSNVETSWEALLGKHFEVHRNFDDFKAWQKAWNTSSVLLLHYEALTSKLLKKLRKIKWKLIVYDEGQRLKNPTSKTSRTAAKLAASGEYRIDLTGTPMDHRLTELFGQFRFIKPELLGSHKEFEYEWLEPIDIDLSKLRKGSVQWQHAIKKMMIMKNKRQIAKEKIDAFIELIKPWSIRIEKSDVLDLPPLRVTPHYVKLRGRQRRLYQQLDRTMIIPELGLVTTLEATKRGKLQEICGGWVKNNEGEVIHVGDAKFGRLIYLMRKRPRPIVIFCRYIAELEGIQEVLRKKFKVGVIRGKNKKDRPAIIKAFQAGKLDVLICQIKAGGVGIDMYRAHYGIAYSTGHSFIDFDQMLARLHRRGQLANVEFDILIVEDTVDTNAYNSVLSKASEVGKRLAMLKPPRRSSHERREQEEARRREEGSKAHVRRRRAGEGAGYRTSVRSRCVT